MLHNPVFVAVDTTDVAQAQELLRTLRNPGVGVKLGLEFFCANGHSGVRRMVNATRRLFLDLKFCDIPNTVAGAIRAVAPLRPDYLTVHCSGGEGMLRAAVDAADSIASTGVKRPKLLGVTVLTSLPSNSDKVEEYATLAYTCGLDGVVCSPHEVARLRSMFKRPFTLMVPGIRPADYGQSDDQVRTATPEAAMDAGADFLVIGRPITTAESPRKALEKILNDLTQDA